MVQKQDLQDCLSLFFFWGGDKPSRIMTWESGNSSPLRIFMLHFIGVHFFLLAHLAGSHPFWIRRHIFELKAMEMNRSCILEGGWLVEIKWPILLSSWLLFFNLGSTVCSRKFTCHLKRDQGPKQRGLFSYHYLLWDMLVFWGSPPENWHHNGKSTIWRCTSYSSLVVSKNCVIFTPTNWGRRFPVWPTRICFRWVVKNHQPVWIFQCHVWSLEVPFLCTKTWSSPVKRCCAVAGVPPVWSRVSGLPAFWKEWIFCGWTFMQKKWGGMNSKYVDTNEIK